MHKAYFVHNKIVNKHIIMMFVFTCTGMWITIVEYSLNPMHLLITQD